MELPDALPLMSPNSTSGYVQIARRSARFHRDIGLEICKLSADNLSSELHLVHGKASTSTEVSRKPYITQTVIEVALTTSVRTGSPKLHGAVYGFTSILICLTQASQTRPQ